MNQFFCLAQFTSYTLAARHTHTYAHTAYGAKRTQDYSAEHEKFMIDSLWPTDKFCYTLFFIIRDSFIA